MLGVAQIEQGFLVCEAKFPDLVCVPIAAQFMKKGLLLCKEFDHKLGLSETIKTMLVVHDPIQHHSEFEKEMHKA